MKDLYTFDINEEQALQTYTQVKMAYAKIFEELNMPVLIAEAESGSMGGNRSDEFHIATHIGEDKVITCCDCDYVANEELAESKRPQRESEPSLGETVNCSIGVTDGLSKLVIVLTKGLGDHVLAKTLTGTNVHALKRLVPELDSGIEAPFGSWVMERKNQDQADPTDSTLSVIVVRQSRLKDVSWDDPGLPIKSWITQAFHEMKGSSILNPDIHVAKVIDTDQSLSRIRENDYCPRCQTGWLHINRAVELGHTFHLGTRYSEPLGLKVGETESSATKTALSMGCHGIGLSRMIGTIASILADEAGLNWPPAVAPYQIVIIPTSIIDSETTELVYDQILLPRKSQEASDAPLPDAVIDDREKTLIQKLKDADLIGFPVIVVLGKSWVRSRRCEVQCRRLKSTTAVPLAMLHQHIISLIAKL